MNFLHALHTLLGQNAGHPQPGQSNQPNVLRGQNPHGQMLQQQPQQQASQHLQSGGLQVGHPLYTNYTSEDPSVMGALQTSHPIYTNYTSEAGISGNGYNGRLQARRSSGGMGNAMPLPQNFLQPGMAPLQGTDNYLGR